MSNTIETRIRPPEHDELGLLAQSYIEAFGGEEWGESHDERKILQKFQQWIEDGTHQVRIAHRNDEYAGFAVTRSVPRNKVIADLTSELEEVSGLSLSEEEVGAFQAKIDQIDQGINHPLGDAAEVGIFQDVVVKPEFRGTSTYLDLMFPMTVELLQRDSLSMMIVYTNPRIKAVVRTLEMLGGTRVYETNDILVFAATKDTIVSRLREFGQWQE